MKDRIHNTENDSPIVKMFTKPTAQESMGQRELARVEQMPVKLDGHDTGNGAIDQYMKMGFIFKSDDKGNILNSSRGDELFVDVQLPDGWKKVPTSHSMWTDLVDNNGMRRGTIFYKASFYDREAFINFNRRFNYSVITFLPEDKKYKTVTEEYYETFEDENFREEHAYLGMNGYEYRSRPSIRRVKKTRTVHKSLFKNHYVETRRTPHYFEITDGDTVIYRSEDRIFPLKYMKNHHNSWWRRYDEFQNELREEAKAMMDSKFPMWKDLDAYWDLSNAIEK